MVGVVIPPATEGTGAAKRGTASKTGGSSLPMIYKRWAALEGASLPVPVPQQLPPVSMVSLKPMIFFDAQGESFKQPTSPSSGAVQGTRSPMSQECSWRLGMAQFHR